MYILEKEQLIRYINSNSLEWNREWTICEARRESYSVSDLQWLITNPFPNGQRVTVRDTGKEYWIFEMGTEFQLR